MISIDAYYKLEIDHAASVCHADRLIAENKKLEDKLDCMKVSESIYDERIKELEENCLRYSELINSLKNHANCANENCTNSYDSHDSYCDKWRMKK